MKKKNLLVFSLLSVCLMGCTESTEPVEPVEPEAEQFEIEIVNTKEMISLILEHGYSAGAFSSWTDCSYHYEVSYNYTFDGVPSVNNSYDEIWDTNAVERNGVERFLGDITRTYLSGLVQTQQDYYDGSGNIAYSKLGSIQIDGTETSSYITQEHTGTLQSDFLDVGSTIDNACNSFSQYVDVLPNERGNYMTAVYGESQYDHIILYIEMGTKAGSYPFNDMEDWVVSEDITTTTLECIYGLDYNLLSFKWSFAESTVWNCYNDWADIMGYEEEIDEVYQEVSLSRYDGEIEEPSWVREMY